MLVAIDHLALVVHLRGHAFEDGSGGKAVVRPSGSWRVFFDGSRGGPRSPNSDVSMSSPVASRAYR
jgi:hypothetical protein